MERHTLRTEDCDEAIDRYADLVYRLAYAQLRSIHDAQDVFQEVFLRYLKSAPVFASEEHRRAWLIRVCTNCCKKLWNSAWRRRVQTAEDIVVFATEEQNELGDALAALPPKYRMVLHLFYYEDLPVEQIAQILGRKPSTVRMQLTRGRALLKQQLERS